MKRYIKLYLSFLRNNISREMEFRTNFIVQSLLNLVWAGVLYITVEVMYRQTTGIGDWSKYEFLTHVAVYSFGNSVFRLFFTTNTQNFSTLVREGTFDFYLTKPVNTLFLTSTRKIQLYQIPRAVLFGVLSVVFASRVNPTLDFETISISLFIVLLGCLSINFYFWIVNVYSFWKPRVWNIFFVFEQIRALGKYPSNIYPSIIKPLAYILPLAAWTTIPTKFMLGEGDIFMFIYAIGIFIIFALGCKIFWNLGIKHYESASS